MSLGLLGAFATAVCYGIGSVLQAIGAARTHASGTLDARRIGDAHPLFAIHPPAPAGYHYDVTPDGRRFLVITDISPSPLPIVVTNWKSAK